MNVPYFFVYKDHASQWRWRFVASNGRTIADSAESYHNLQDCEHGIALVKKESPGAVTIGDDNYKRNRP
ncbi:YegP family protein [Variovorax sp. JS1663]|uniref:YegP family protein n=1 Tax=Variovorax sp. JS1663 TaxID=1851577 RepID=UPI000B348D8A|nr:DUF1508 domain-containing protein [Variovorax sp. JS1663]OUM01767.1 hypothetical protein A8M77_14490 [Variovorax sp. JS1663]